jgi:hypothetical protein
MIASRDVYVDLHAFSLSDHRQARVFSSRETAAAYGQIVQTSPTSPHSLPGSINLVAGDSLNWDGKNWTIVNVGDTKIGLINIDHFFTELPIVAFEKLIGEGRITGMADDSAPAAHPKVKELFAAASCSDHATANHRSELVRSYLKGELSSNEFPVPARTFYRWVKQYREAQETLGSGYLGLLPQPNTGNGKDKLPAIKAIATRLGLKTTGAIHHNFPELERAIADRARAYWEAGLKRAQLALESALTEVPPPSVPEVARNTNHGVGKLYLHFPDLCRQVAANYSAYRHQRSIARMEEKRKSKMNRLPHNS